MRRYVTLALLLAMLPLTACAPEPSPDAEPQQTSTPASEAAEPSPAETSSPAPETVTVAFAHGYASAEVPDGWEYRVEDIDGDPPRHTGGLLTVQVPAGGEVHISVLSAAGLRAAQSGPPCGTEAIAELPGNESLSEENSIFVLAAGETAAQSESFLAMLAKAAPVGQICADQVRLATPDGGAVSAVFTTQLPAGTTNAEAEALIAGNEELLGLLRSVTVE